MKKEQVLELMNSVDPGLVEEADVDPPAKRRLPGMARTGLIAACLCLALVGSAFAAISGIRERRLVHLEPHIDGAGVFDGYMVSGDLDAYRLRDFSSEFLEAGKTGTGRVDMEFDAIDEARAYLGEGIPCAWPDGWDGSFTVSLFHNEKGEIWGSEVISWDAGGHTCIRMRVLTEKCAAKGDDEKILGLYGGFGAKEQLESYHMPNGAVAEAFTLGASEYDPDYCSCNSFFILDGNIYEVYTYDTPSHQAELWPRIQAILDRFP